MTATCPDLWRGQACRLPAGHDGPHIPVDTPPAPARQGMTDWQKFALLVFTLVLLAVVVLAWINVSRQML